MLFLNVKRKERCLRRRQARAGLLEESGTFSRSAFSKCPMKIVRCLKRRQARAGLLRKSPGTFSRSAFSKCPERKCAASSAGRLGSGGLESPGTFSRSAFLFGGAVFLFAVLRRVPRRWRAGLRGPPAGTLFARTLFFSRASGGIRRGRPGPRRAGGRAARAGALKRSYHRCDYFRRGRRPKPRPYPHE